MSRRIKKEVLSLKQEVLDEKTGEVMIAERLYIRNEVPQEHFKKVYLVNLLKGLVDITDDKQLEIILFMSANISNNNIFVGSQKDLAKYCNTSIQTVSKTIKKLTTYINSATNQPMIKKIGNNIYMLDPNLIVQGDYTHRQILIDFYTSENIKENKTYLLKKIPKDYKDKEEFKIVEKEFKKLSELTK